MKLNELSINSKIVDNLTSLGYTDLTEIQAAVMQPMLDNTNILAQAQTGSGKTAAFLIPIIEKIMNNKDHKALVVAPTRDLAMQIFDNAIKYAKMTGIKCGNFYGGSSYSRQLRFLDSGVDIIIGTPGRLMDLHKRKNLDLGEVNYLVLDEADQMLDMGFIDDIRKIRNLVGKVDQISFFSATMPKNVMKLVDEIMEEYDTHKIQSRINVNDVITQSAYMSTSNTKPKILLDILGDSNRTNQQAIIFSRTKNEASDIAMFLRRNKIKVEALHSDRSQSSRTIAMKKFRNNEVQVLVATNVAARGIDIANLPLVINYNLPEDIETYVHRIGRTGRVGNKGEAISLVTKADAYVLGDIERKIGAKIELITEEKYLTKGENDVEHNIRESQVKRSKPKGQRSGGDSRGRSSGGYGSRGGDRRGSSDRNSGERSFGDRSRGDRNFSDRPRGERSFGDKPRGDRNFSDRPRGERSFGDKPRGDRNFSDRPRGERNFGDKPRGDRNFSDRPRGERSFGDKPRGDRGSFGGGESSSSSYGRNRSSDGQRRWEDKSGSKSRGDRRDRSDSKFGDSRGGGDRRNSRSSRSDSWSSSSKKSW
ncbi:MAG: DEAD/DEAH box helicase [Mycoplasma sp.]